MADEVKNTLKWYFCPLPPSMTKAMFTLRCPFSTSLHFLGDISITRININYNKE